MKIISCLLSIIFLFQFSCNIEKRHFEDKNLEFNYSKKVFIANKDTLNFNILEIRNKIVKNKSNYILGKENFKIFDSLISKYSSYRNNNLITYHLVYNLANYNNNDTIDLLLAKSFSTYSLLPDKKVWFNYFNNINNYFINEEWISCESVLMMCNAEEILFKHYFGEGIPFVIGIYPDTCSTIEKNPNAVDSLFYKLDNLK